MDTAGSIPPVLKAHRPGWRFFFGWWNTDRLCSSAGEGQTAPPWLLKSLFTVVQAPGASTPSVT